MTQHLEHVRHSLLTRRRVLGAMAAAPVAAALLAKGFGVGATDAPATPPMPALKFPPDKVEGTVTGVSGGTLTVQQADGTTATVTTSDTTGATLLKTITLSDLQVGDVISVSGDRTSDTAWTATSIMHLSGMKDLPHGAIRIGAGTPPADFTGTPVAAGRAIGYVRVASGTVGTFTNGTPPPAGSKPTTFFISAGDGTGKPGLIGQITAISGTTLTVKTPEDTNVTVSTDASTTALTNESGGVSDIRVGDSVTAVGQKQDTSLTAIAISFRHSG